MFSNVWSENTALFERLMEIHSNSPKLYYGFNFDITIQILIRVVHAGHFPHTTEEKLDFWRVNINDQIKSLSFIRLQRIKTLNVGQILTKAYQSYICMDHI